MAELKAKLERYKYPALILLVGIMLMLVPGTKKEVPEECDEAQLLCQALSKTEGVGEVKVILSENGAVIVCEGAKNAGVRLDIIRAVCSYTGFTSDKISVLKMTEY